MKSFLISFTLFLGVISAFHALALQSDGKSDEAVLADVDAVGALAMANQWNRYLVIIVFGGTGIVGLLRNASHLSPGAYSNDARDESLGSP